jgi:hypothetical protein
LPALCFWLLPLAARGKSRCDIFLD